VVANPITDYVPRPDPVVARPTWLECDGTLLSTIDLVGNGFVLLTGPNGNAWNQAAQRLASDISLSLKALTVGDDGIEIPMGNGWPHTVSTTLAPCWSDPMATWHGAALQKGETTLYAALSGIPGYGLSNTVMPSSKVAAMGVSLSGSKRRNLPGRDRGRTWRRGRALLLQGVPATAATSLRKALPFFLRPRLFGTARLASKCSDSPRALDDSSMSTAIMKSGLNQQISGQRR
jgi:hypothetical protein